MSDETEKPSTTEAPEPSVTVTQATLAPPGTAAQEVAPVPPVTVLLTAEEIATLIQAGAQLFALVQKVKANQPDAWAAVAADFSASVDAFETAAPAAGYSIDVPLGEHVSAPMGPPETPVTVAGAQV